MWLRRSNYCHKFEQNRSVHVFYVHESHLATSKRSLWKRGRRGKARKRRRRHGRSPERCGGIGGSARRHRRAVHRGFGGGGRCGGSWSTGHRGTRARLGRWHAVGRSGRGHRAAGARRADSRRTRRRHDGQVAVGRHGGLRSRRGSNCRRKSSNLLALRLAAFGRGHGSGFGRSFGAITAGRCGCISMRWVRRMGRGRILRRGLKL